MRGHNELKLNGATMQEAVQEWLDRRWNKNSGGPTPEVTDLRAEQTHGSVTFMVHLTEPEGTDDQ